MKKNYIALALLIGLLAACDSDTKDTSATIDKQNEGAEVSHTAPAATESTKTYALITDPGIGVSNNKETERPENI
jgi:uncharacterized lipoprotein